METLVVGAGAMGRWLGRALREDAPESVDLFFLDADPEAAGDAARTVGGEVASGGRESIELVCIAVPIPAVERAITEHGPRAREAVVDVTGTMRAPVAAMSRHVPDCERASLHPLFAPANEPGNVPAVFDRRGPVVDTVVTALEGRGNTVFETTPAEHDRAMETVQARAHAAVLAFALATEGVPERFHTPISAALTDLVGQVTDGDGRVYADIQAAFDGADDVATAAAQLAAADTEGFRRLYERASEDR